MGWTIALDMKFRQTVLGQNKYNGWFWNLIAKYVVYLLPRKRILQGLMYGCSTGGSVDELQEVELKIELLQQEVQHKLKNSI